MIQTKKHRIITHDDIMEIGKNVSNLKSVSLEYLVGKDQPRVTISVKYGMNKKTIEYLEAQFQLHITSFYRPHPDFSDDEDEINVFFESPNYLLNEINQ